MRVCTISIAAASGGGYVPPWVLHVGGNPRGPWPGSAFAPTHDALVYLHQARLAGPQELDRAWPIFCENYRAEMLISAGHGHRVDSWIWRQAIDDGARHDPAAWWALPGFAAAAPDGVLWIGCWCPEPDLCHRPLLAGFLARLGAIYEGECRDVPTQ